MALPLFLRFLLLGLVAILTVSAYDDMQPILMDRRDLSPFGDIVSDLKSKTLGGRMRFGKRSGPVAPLSAQEWRANYLSGY